MSLVAHVGSEPAVDVALFAAVIVSVGCASLAALVFAPKLPRKVQITTNVLSGCTAAAVWCAANLDWTARVMGVAAFAYIVWNLDSAMRARSRVDELDSGTKRRRLVEAVQLLAADANVQLSVFPDFAVKADEVVSTFGEVFAFVPELVDSGLLSAGALDQLRRLDAHIDGMGRDGPSMWTESAVEQHSAWEELRRLARAALGELGESRRPPRVDWATYVSGRD
jgi:hypothetical protein